MQWLPPRVSTPSKMLWRLPSAECEDQQHEVATLLQHALAEHFLNCCIDTECYGHLQQFLDISWPRSLSSHGKRKMRDKCCQVQCQRKEQKWTWQVTLTHFDCRIEMVFSCSFVFFGRGLWRVFSHAAIRWLNEAGLKHGGVLMPLHNAKMSSLS